MQSPPGVKGMLISDEVKDVFTQTRMRKIGFLILKVNNDASELQFDSKYPLKTPWEDVVKNLPEKECRYLFFESDIPRPNKTRICKTVMISWIPLSCPIKQKAIMASTKSNLLQELKGVQYQDVFDCEEDLKYSNMEQIMMYKFK